LARFIGVIVFDLIDIFRKSSIYLKIFLKKEKKVINSAKTLFLWVVLAL